jgi:hypothetical protein
MCQDKIGLVSASRLGVTRSKIADVGNFGLLYRLSF